MQRANPNANFRGCQPRRCGESNHGRQDRKAHQAGRVVGRDSLLPPVPCIPRNRLGHRTPRFPDAWPDATVVDGEFVSLRPTPNQEECDEPVPRLAATGAVCPVAPPSVLWPCGRVLVPVPWLRREVMPSMSDFALLPPARRSLLLLLSGFCALLLMAGCASTGGRPAKASITICCRPRGFCRSWWS